MSDRTSYVEGASPNPLLRHATPSTRAPDRRPEREGLRPERLLMKPAESGTLPRLYAGG